MFAGSNFFCETVPGHLYIFKDIIFVQNIGLKQGCFFYKCSIYLLSYFFIGVILINFFSVTQTIVATTMGFGIAYENQMLLAYNVVPQDEMLQQQ